MEKSVQNPEEYAFLMNTISMLSRKDAVDALVKRWPHKARSWFNRNLAYLVELDPFQLGEMLGHSDPTAKHALTHATGQGTCRLCGSVMGGQPLAMVS